MVLLDSFAGEVLASLITGIFALILYFVNYLVQIQRAKNLKKKKDTVLDTLEHNERIDIKLEELRLEYDADRICIYRFHNGGHYYPNTDMQKFSVAYEKVSPGVSSLIMLHQNLLVSAFHWQLSKTIKDKGFFYKDVELIEDYSTKDFLSNNGIRSIYNFPIFSLTGKAIAFVTVQYVKDKKNLTGNILDDLESTLNSLTGYLE